MSKWTSVDRLDAYDAIVSDDTKEAFVTSVGGPFKCMVWDTDDSWRASVFTPSGWWTSANPYRVRGDAERGAEAFARSIADIPHWSSNADQQSDPVVHDPVPNTTIHRVLDVLEKVVDSL